MKDVKLTYLIVSKRIIMRFLQMSLKASNPLSGMVVDGVVTREASIGLTYLLWLTYAAPGMTSSWSHSQSTRSW